VSLAHDEKSEYERQFAVYKGFLHAGDQDKDAATTCSSLSGVGWTRRLGEP